MEKLDLIILPFHDYKKWLSEGFRTRDAHLFEHFKKNENVNKILVINRPVSRGEQIVKYKQWKTETKNKELYVEKNWRIVQVDTNAYYLDILSNDIFKVIFERKKWWHTVFNYDETIKIINKACDILKLNNRCLLLQNPMSMGIIGNINEKIVAFDAIDNWLYHPQNIRYRELLFKNYELIDKKADIIFTVSEKLKLLFKTNKNIKWVANGVDIEYFSKSICTKNRKNKITIGYVGKIQDRLDFELIQKCLMEFKELDFIFLGPVLACKDKVKYLKKNFKNISFLGDIHYNDLPNRMKNIDIAIIPHLVNEFTNSMNPLKLYEYLAAGKQVVTTTIAGSENLSKYIYISDNHNEFINNIDKALNKYLNSHNLSEEIIRTINKDCLWESKSEIIIQRILNLM